MKLFIVFLHLLNQRFYFRQLIFTRIVVAEGLHHELHCRALGATKHTEHRLV